MYILFCGTRTFDSFTAVRDVVAQLRTLLGDFTVLHGGARGADTWAGLAALAFDLPEKEVKPDYERYGRYLAPKIRNTEMLDLSPAYVVAFWDGHSGGTLDTITKAVNHYRIPTLICRS